MCWLDSCRLVLSNITDSSWKVNTCLPLSARRERRNTNNDFLLDGVSGSDIMKCPCHSASIVLSFATSLNAIGYLLYGFVNLVIYGIFALLASFFFSYLSQILIIIQIYLQRSQFLSRVA